MTLYLVRHARGEKRGVFPGSDFERPLSPSGRDQAASLAQSFRDIPIDRILTSPYARCVSTVEPLAVSEGLDIEVDDRLAEGAGERELIDILKNCGDGNVVVCSHGDVIPALLLLMGASEPPLRCGKGSVWCVERGARPTATYWSPPVSDVRPTRMAVLDLGSTSFHLLVADLDADGGLTRVCREREMLRLGAMISGRAGIPPELEARATAAVVALRDVARAAGAQSLLCVATAAFRDAKHGPQLARALADVLELPVTILSAAEEAHAIFTAFRERIGFGDSPEIGIDLGGGSLEIAIGDAEDVEWETTLPLGVVRLHRRFLEEGGRGLDAIRDATSKALAKHRSRVAALETERCVAAGGTVAALGRLVLAEAGEKGSALRGFVLERDVLGELAEALGAATHNELLAMPGMDTRRADLLPTGAVVLHTLLTDYDFPSLTISDWGLREGVLVTAARDAGAAARWSGGDT